VPTYESTLLIERQSAIAIITINRPEKLNALNFQILNALRDTLDSLEQDSSVKVLIFTGMGDKAFVAGADIEQLSQMSTMEIYDVMTFVDRLFLRIAEFPKPTIAMVNGYALGGGFELALCCDMLVASENAVFGFPEINLNTLPGWGGTQLAVKKMGWNRAREMVLTGQRHSADYCRDFGFINRLVPAAQLRAATLELAGSLAGKNSFALKVAKNALLQAGDLPLPIGMRYETLAYATNFSAPHAKDGFKAFLERKRK
jgi:enoyl-CoA hydratase